MGRTKWSEIRKMAAPETLEAAAQKKETLEAALELRELARESGLTQEALAERLEQAQGNASRLLRRSDMHISTLGQVVEAMGGELKVHGTFPMGKITGSASSRFLTACELAAVAAVNVFYFNAALLRFRRRVRCSRPH